MSRLPSAPWSRASPPSAAAIPRRSNGSPWMTRPPARRFAVMWTWSSAKPTTEPARAAAGARSDAPSRPRTTTVLIS
jgi:hypothetical protein